MSHLASDSVHLGYKVAELASSPLSRLDKPDMVPLPAQLIEAMALGLQAKDLRPSLESAPDVQAKSDWPFETGVSKSPGGEGQYQALWRAGNETSCRQLAGSP